MKNLIPLSINFCPHPNKLSVQRRISLELLEVSRSNKILFGVITIEMVTIAMVFSVIWLSFSDLVLANLLPLFIVEVMGAIGVLLTGIQILFKKQIALRNRALAQSA